MKPPGRFWAFLRAVVLAASFGVGVSSLFRAMPAGADDDLPPLAWSLVAAPFAALGVPGMIFGLICFFVVGGQKLPLTPAARARWRGQTAGMLAFHDFFGVVALAFGAGLAVAGLRHGLRLAAFGVVFLGAGAGWRFGVRWARRTWAAELAEPSGREG